MHKTGYVTCVVICNMYIIYVIGEVRICIFIRSRGFTHVTLFNLYHSCLTWAPVTHPGWHMRKWKFWVTQLSGGPLFQFVSPRDALTWTWDLESCSPMLSPAPAFSTETAINSDIQENSKKQTGKHTEQKRVYHYYSCRKKQTLIHSRILLGKGRRVNRKLKDGHGDTRQTDSVFYKIKSRAGNCVCPLEKITFSPKA